jgi:hypothetical protein
MMLFQSLPTSVNRALQEAHWLFFDLGNTLISEDAATECRIQRLVEALARHGRRYSTDEVRSAFEEAAATFALRPVITVIEKLVDDPACRREVAAQAPYSKELEAPYGEAEDVLRTLSGSYKIGVIANQSVSSTERLTKWGLMPYMIAWNFYPLARARGSYPDVQNGAAQGCAGGGGSNGCCKPRWSMTSDHWRSPARATLLSTVRRTRSHKSGVQLAVVDVLKMRGLSIEEIARSLRRDQREVRDKVAEVGRACR